MVGVSLVATLVSTIGYLATPGEVLGKGPVIFLGMLAYPVVYLIVGYVLLPIYMKQRVTSAYELLEDKLGVGIRVMAACMFIALRLVWMALLIYLAAKSMTVMMGVEEKYIPVVVFVTGLVAVIYTSLGGMRAVLVTDALQTSLMVGGAWLVIGTVTYKLGGLDWIPRQWQDNWDTQPLFSLDPTTRVTVLGTVISVTTWFICTMGGDQVSVQRFMSTQDVRAARRAMLSYLCVGPIVGITLLLVGLSLLGYFETNPAELPPHLNLQDKADEIFPYFIAYHLPAGISGLVMAALFAAAMSSIDSGVNSITAVVTSDFLERFRRQPKSDRANFLLTKVLAFGIGVIVISGSSVMEYVPGNFMEMTQRTVELFVTPIFALFFFALFVPFARPAGVLVGTIGGLTTAVLIAYSGQIFKFLYPETDLDPISFQWIGISALLVNLGNRGPWRVGSSHA